jgi:RNA polymerase sigma-70 factor (ECF subfamily)
VAEIRQLLDTVYRTERSRILATMIRLTGSFDRAEEAVQEALTSALSTWPKTGVPANPAAWLTATAHRKLIDEARREVVRRRAEPALAAELVIRRQPPDPAEADNMTYPDERLRLMFTCCHPALSTEAQVALTLRTLGGLTTGEIADAFLIPEATLAQRLVRAKKKIQAARIPYEVPPPERFPERMTAVQAVLYLIFNEGYCSSSSESLTRADLAQEAIRLTRLLCRLTNDDPESLGLLALMLLHDSRRNVRVSNTGELVLLAQQDRSRWNREQIQEGTAILERALLMRRPGPYQLQAAIAAIHANAATADKTDWPQIAALYQQMERVQPSPVVTLNRAVAVAMSGDVHAALQITDSVAAVLDGYYLLHATRADLLRRSGQQTEAVAAYRRAMSLTSNSVERRFLQHRLESLGQDASGS